MGKNKSETIYKKLLKSVIIGSIIGIVVCLLLISITSFLLTKGGVLPLDYITLITTIIACVSVFMGVYIAVRISKSNGLVTGGSVGFVLFLILFIFGVILGNKTNLTDTLTKAAAMIVSGCISGIMGVNKRRSSSRLR